MRARAFSSTANLGPGFDVFGLAIDAYSDTVAVSKTDDPGIRVVADGGVPLDAEQNTAAVAIRAIQEDIGISDGVLVDIQKGVPPGYGMGSSAASAAAAAVAYDALYDLKLDTDRLVQYAGHGEIASAGASHYDNVAASVCGDFVMVRDGPKVIHVPAPDDLVMCVTTPRIKTPKQKTKVSRSVLPGMVPLKDATRNLANATALAAGFFTGDVSLICNSMNDCIVEPARKHLMTNFDNVRTLALEAGALGVSISGAGPSVIVFAGADADMPSIRDAMIRGFEPVPCDAVICRSAPGATVIQ